MNSRLVQGFFALVVVVLLSACVHSGVATGTKLVARDTKVDQLAVIYETPHFDEARGYNTAASWATQHWGELRPLLKEQTGPVMGRFAVKAHVYDEPPPHGTLVVSEPFVLVVRITSASYTSRTGYGLLLNLALQDGRTREVIWTSSGNMSGGIVGKYDAEFAASFVEKIGTSLSKAGLLGAGLASQGATVPEASASATAGASQPADAGPPPKRLGVASLRGEALVAFKEYKTKLFPRAFVLADDGYYTWLAGRQWDGVPPSQRALETCKSAGHPNCHVISVDWTDIN